MTSAVLHLRTYVVIALVATLAMGNDGCSKQDDDPKKDRYWVPQQITPPNIDSTKLQEYLSRSAADTAGISKPWDKIPNIDLIQDTARQYIHIQEEGKVKPSHKILINNLVRDVLTFSDQHVNLLLQTTGSSPSTASSCGPQVEYALLEYFYPELNMPGELWLPSNTAEAPCLLVQQWPTTPNQRIGMDWNTVMADRLLNCVRSYHAQIAARVGTPAHGSFRISGLNYGGNPHPITNVQYASRWIGDVLDFYVVITR